VTVDLTKLGVYCRCPGGQVETIPQQLATGVTWAALNLGSDPCVDRDPSVWAHQRSLYASGGIPVAPWLHCRSFADVQYVVAIAKSWESEFVGVNLEDVNTDGISLAQVAAYLKGSDWGKPVHMATLPWVQNSAGWGAMAFATAALEMFPEEDPRYLADWQGCVNHAFAEGLKTVTLLYSTQSPRSVYPNVAHMLYTADNVTDWPSWKDSLPQPLPKPPNGGNMSLSPALKKQIRFEMTRFCLVAEKAELRWHYTEARPYTGLGVAPAYTHHNDCSSYCALVFFWAGHMAGHGIADPLAGHYGGSGNTETALDFLEAHPAPRAALRVGDMCIFGIRGQLGTQHMQICRRPGAATQNTGTGSAIFSSFGSESGPQPEPAIYAARPLIGIYRHPALL